jgi:integrase
MINHDNYLLVKEFKAYSINHARASEASVERYWFYWKHLLEWADENPLENCHTIKLPFTGYVDKLTNDKTQKQLSYSSRKKIIEHSKALLQWAKMRYPAKFKKVTLEWIASLTPPTEKRDMTEHEYYSEDDIRRIISILDKENDLVIRRDVSGVVFEYLSGMRTGAFTTLPNKAVNISLFEVKQHPDLGVKTKNGVKATTTLLNIPEFIEIVKEWDETVRNELGPDGLWYPPIDQFWGEQRLTPKKPGQKWNTSFNKRLKLLTEKAGIPYLPSHKLRHGHAVYGLDHARTMADFKAVSVNLMHESITITDSVYASLSNQENKRRIIELSSQPTHCPDDELSRFLSKLSKTDKKRASHMLLDLID